MRTSIKAALTAAAASLALLCPTLAVADVVTLVQTQVAASGSTTIAMVNGQAQTTLDFYLQPTNSDCNAGDGSAAVVSISVLGPSAMAVNPTSLSFTACHSGSNKNSKPVTFTAVQAGTYDVTTSVADTNPQDGYVTLSFQIIVTGPSNTAPTVALTGVTNGSSYEFGQVPAAVCQATDAQDGAQPGTVSFSAITGPLSAYGLGSRTATCSYTDTGGLSATPVSATYTIVDTTKPVVVAPADQTIDATIPAGAVATWSPATASDAVGLAAGSPSCDHPSGDLFPFGTTTVTCTATDVAGNTAEADTFTITVKDDTKPTITGGGAAPVEATGPTTPVTYTLPTANDDVDGPLIPVCLPASGSSFPVGVTEVTCTATDEHDNFASTTFSIVVTDTTAPDLTAADVVGVEATSPNGAAATYTATASDLVDGSVTVNCVPASGSTFGLGLTTVSCSATDAHGNTGSATFTVEVVDTTDPELTVPDPIVVEATAPGGNVVNFTASATDTVDTDVLVSCIPPSGSTFAITVTTVDCTATDDYGNTDQASFTVTVQDTIDPEISGPTRTPAGVDGTDADGVGWNKTDVTFVWTCTDSGSGPKDATITKTVSTEGAGQTVNATCEDLAGNTATSADETVNLDKTAPSLGISGPANGSTIDICTAARPTFSPTDLRSGVDPATAGSSWTTPSELGLGDYVFSAHADDYATNHAEESRTYHGVYGSAYSGVLQPVNLDGRSRFKIGSTIPVKFRLECGGVSITNAQASLRLTKADGAPDPGVDEAVSTSAATAGNLFRYDASGQQYIFNLNTKAPYTNPGGTAVTPSVGTWTLFINLGDGTPSRSVQIQISK